MKVYEYMGELFDDEAIATIVAENWMEMLIGVYGDDLRGFLCVLPDPIADDIEDWLLDDRSGHANWDMLGVRVRDVKGREEAIDNGVRL